VRNGVTLIANGGVNGAAGGSIKFLDEYGTFSRDILGNPRVKVFGNGVLDTSLSQGAIIASLDGNGNVLLGDTGLSVSAFHKDLISNFSGIIQGGAPASGGLVIGGTMTLSGANTYGGHTDIAGTGAVGFINNTSGSGTGTGEVRALFGGTLGGNGTIAGPVIVTGLSVPGLMAFLAPGGTATSTGTLTIQSTLTFSNGIYDFELNSDTGTADKVIADGVTIPDSIFGESLFSFTDLGQSLLTIGTEFTVIENTSLSLIDGTFGNLRGGFVFTGDFNTFEVDYKGGDGNDLTLTVRKSANVPDGGTTLSLLTLAVSGLTLLRRMIA
nr:hypothetical protein [Verrucomicrobiota bacterium]